MPARITFLLSGNVQVPRDDIASFIYNKLIEDIGSITQSKHSIEMVRSHFSINDTPKNKTTICSWIRYCIKKFKEYNLTESIRTKEEQIEQLSKLLNAHGAGTSQTGNDADTDGDDDGIEVMLIDKVKVDPSVDIPPEHDEISSSSSDTAAPNIDLAVQDSGGSSKLVKIPNKAGDDDVMIVTGQPTSTGVAAPKSNFERNHNQFVKFVSQSLLQLPSDTQRSKLKIEIEIAILNAKKEWLYHENA